MKNKMMEQDVENMGIMAGFKDMMEMEDDDTEDTNEEDRVASEVMGRSPKSPEILMNNLRGDMRSVEARIDELADMVGYRAAKDTPQEVLALLQPVLAQQQGIGAAPASAELMQGPQPPMAPPPGMPPMMPPGAPPEAAPGGMPPEMMAAMMGGAGGPQGMAGPPAPETGGIAGAPPMAMARGGYVQNFQAGSTEDGVTPVETVPGEREEPLLKYPTDMVAAAKQGMQELIARQPATIPDLGALARGREPAYRTILGDTKGASEAQMLFSLGQRAFNFGANTDDQGRPLRGSFISRMAGAVRTLPQDMMARAAEIDKGERAIKMAALQASEKDIDQLQSANSKLTEQKRALFGDIIKSEARIEAEKQKNLNKPPKGPFGSGVTGETLNIFTKMAPDYAAGKLDPEQDRVFLAAVTNYTQPQERVEERTDPVTGNKSYVTIQTRPELPSFVRSALQLRGTVLPNTSAAPAPGGGKPGGAKAPAPPPGAAGDISGAPGTVPADVPTEARDAYVALKTPKDQKTLWNQRGLVAGPVQYIKTLPVLRVFGQVDAKADEARTFFDSARRSLIKALAANPRYPVSEMQAIEKEIDIAPAFFDNPNSLGNRLIGIEDFLNQRLKAAERDSVNPDFPVASRQAALDEIKELKNFNKVAGIPPRVYTIEEVQALPSGTNFLWNGQVSKWKK
jgi:hypothetical protein